MIEREREAGKYPGRGGWPGGGPGPRRLRYDKPGGAPLTGMGSATMAGGTYDVCMYVCMYVQFAIRTYILLL